MENKMKALVKSKTGRGAEIMFLDIPQPGPGELLVKVKAASICGTDLHIYRWDKWAESRIRPPVVLGHEMAGEVAAVGPAVRNIRRGDYVSLECHKTCGICYQCKTGQSHICSSYSILGVDFDGCFAEYVRVPEENLWINDPELPPEIASLQDPIGNAVLALSPAKVTGKTVMITGCGPIGLFAVGLARVSGAARIFAVDINDYRLDLAARMGANVLINPRTRDVVKKILHDTGGCGVDIAFEISGIEKCLHDGLGVLKNGGKMVLLGIPEKSVTLDVANDVIFKGITIFGITGREIYKTWYDTAALLNGILDVSPVITHRMRLDDFAEAFRIMEEGLCGKIILYPQEGVGSNERTS